MIDGELTAAPEQIRERAIALRSFEQIGLLDRDPGQPAALGANCVELVGYRSLLGEERLAGDKPFVARYDFRRESGDSVSLL